MTNKIANFEVFKGAKELDDNYSSFLGNIERFFGADVSMEGLLKRLYYTMRFLEGTIRALSVLKLLSAISVDEQKRGMKFIAKWLRELADDLEAEYNDFKRR